MKHANFVLSFMTEFHRRKGKQFSVFEKEKKHAGIKSEKYW